MKIALKISLYFLGAMASSCINAEEIGRLFFTPEQRAQLDYSYARMAQPDSDNSSSMTLNGIVQRQGGKRTAWINGTPQLVGQSDEKSPASVSVAIPGQRNTVKLKVGQRVLLSPSATPETIPSNTPKSDTPKQDPSDDD